jgi:Spy/CpxP family protein refolding chaperone
MGVEIEHEMEGLDQELAQLGDKIGREFARKFGKDFSKDWAKSLGPGGSVTGVPGAPHGRDSDDEDDDEDEDDKDSVTLPPGADSADADSADLAPAIAQLKGKLALDDAQRTQLARLRADSDTQVARAKHDLEQMSDRLHDALRDDSANETEIARQIDSISEREATIRKARILTWIKARNVLRADQRRQVEDAVRRGH